MSFASNSLGPHGHWGFSSTFDIIEAFLRARSEFVRSDPINILLIEPNDIRHLICCISKIRRHFPCLDQRPLINIYFLESSLEVLTRDLVMLALFTDWEVPIRQRSTIFLEVYGNGYVQKRTASYLQSLAENMQLLMSTGIGNLQQALDFEQLSFKEKDHIENALKMYRQDQPFDMNRYLDHRRRGLYQDRYDARRGMQDWDYHSSLRSTASIIHIKQYKHWRDTSIAYEFGDQSYTEANRTLMSYTEGTMKSGQHKGTKKEVQGFWGDLVVSPYIALGIDCDTPNKYAEELFEIVNKNTGTEQHRHHAVEIGLYNLFSFLWEIESGKPYQMQKAHDIFSGLGSENVIPQRSSAKELSDTSMPINDETSEVEAAEVISNTLSTLNEIRCDDPSLEDNLFHLLLKSESIENAFTNVKIIPLGSSSSILNKSKFSKKFEFVFVSSRSAHLVGDERFEKLLREGQTVVAVESAKFLVPLTKESKKEFNEKVVELAAKNNLAPIDNPVFRRMRDENDKEKDLLFFIKS